MKTKLIVLAVLVLTLFFAGEVSAQKGMAGSPSITVRTENYPRPPYSGATYYIYERKDSGEIICTKLAVCNKFGDCENTYRKGSFKEAEDVQTGEPYGRSPRVVIGNRSLGKHVCLTRFGFLPK